jgi:hypothetical protein
VPDGVPDGTVAVQYKYFGLQSQKGQNPGPLQQFANNSRSKRARFFAGGAASPIGAPDIMCDDSDDECLADAKLRLRAEAAAKFAAASSADTEGFTSQPKRGKAQDEDDDDDIFVSAVNGDTSADAVSRNVNKRRRLRRGGGRAAGSRTGDSSDEKGSSDDDGSDDDDDDDSSEAASDEESSSAESGESEDNGEEVRATIPQRKPPTADDAARAARWARSGVGEAKTAREYEEAEARRLSKREKQQVRAPAPLLQEATSVGAVWTACAAQPRPAWSRALQPTKAVEEEERRNHLSMAAVESRHGLSKHNATARDEDVHLAASRAAAEAAEIARARAQPTASAKPGGATRVAAAGGAPKHAEPARGTAAPAAPPGAPRPPLFPRASAASQSSMPKTASPAAAKDAPHGVGAAAPEPRIGVRRTREESDTSTPPPPAPPMHNGASAAAKFAQRVQQSGKQPCPLGPSGSGATRPLLPSMMRSRLPQASAVRCGGLLPSAVRMPSSLRESTGSAGLQALAKGNAWSFVSTSRTASTSNLRAGSGARQVAAAANGAASAAVPAPRKF